MVLAHEQDPDLKMRPYKDNIDVELREKLILGIAGAMTAIYRYFAPQRRMMIAGLGAKRTAHRQADRKIGRNDPCPCGSGKKNWNFSRRYRSALTSSTRAISAST
jgi:hypothetical protein